MRWSENSSWNIIIEISGNACTMDIEHSRDNVGRVGQVGKQAIERFNDDRKFFTSQAIWIDSRTTVLSFQNHRHQQRAFIRSLLLFFIPNTAAWNLKTCPAFGPERVLSKAFSDVSSITRPSEFYFSTTFIFSAAWFIHFIKTRNDCCMCADYEVTVDREV